MKVTAQYSEGKARGLGVYGQPRLHRKTLSPKIKVNNFKIYSSEVGEMAQQLRALTILPEDPGSIPSTHMAAYNYL